jgi:hypothetical protein
LQAGGRRFDPVWLHQLFRSALLRFALFERGQQSAHRTSDIEALAKSRISAGGLAANCGYLLHREEGIDLRLSRAARPQGLAEKCRLPGQRSKPPRCWVSLDENLVLTSVPPFWRYRPLACLSAFASKLAVAVSKKKQALILRKQYSASTHLSSGGY